MSGCYRLRTLARRKSTLRNFDGRLERHSRHILLPQVGAEGQTSFQSRVLCLGLVAWRPVIQYLAAAGIGHLTIVDDDVVEISNLQRQVIHRTSDVGVPKAQSAQRFVNELDPNISVDAIEVE